MAENNQLAIATNPEQQGALEVRQQVNQIQYLMKSVLQKDVHYGVVPGTGKNAKPSLFQAGAEKIAYMFHMLPSYEVHKTDLGSGHREYEVTCQLTSRDSGEVMGMGVGTCTTLESKYRYRSEWVNGNKVRHENPDIADTWNTCLKMAKKRAFVDAVKSTTAASDIFTQDVEDMPEFTYQQQPAQQVHAEVQQAPAKPTPTKKEKSRMGEVADLAASVGINRDEARKYIWGLYQTNGMPSVETWAAQIAPAPAPEPEPMPESEQVEELAYEEAVEPDLYDADESF